MSIKDMAEQALLATSTDFIKITTFMLALVFSFYVILKRYINLFDKKIKPSRSRLSRYKEKTKELLNYITKV